ncbi:hypothetical protein OOZ51_13115 [Arthrobacter sp. MI7-26]|uniref:hypothetical protein n=1 Tax=Arthrobacter sp. MI7-26 TaxID=2993653 RepID=UPI002249714C|nr:hypothetical protein [Arthrobacter sp. MI7-26]MCX2748745.1 hypothetical protein [Arthrobacter sp. MI7-26]
MERDASGELEGQSSINELLDEAVGSTHAQLVLPIRPSEARSLPARVLTRTLLPA